MKPGSYWLILLWLGLVVACGWGVCKSIDQFNQELERLTPNLEPGPQP
jgi:hypothetical protein